MVRPSAYVVVRNDDGLFAVVRAPAACMLPGGGIEEGETPQQTIQREAAEECGLSIVVGGELGRAVEIVYVPADATCYEKRSVFFEGGITGHAQRTELDHELLWLDRDTARATLSYGSHRWILER